MIALRTIVSERTSSTFWSSFLNRYRSFHIKMPYGYVKVRCKRRKYLIGEN